MRRTTGPVLTASVVVEPTRDIRAAGRGSLTCFHQHRTARAPAWRP
jgi:hypothetical protein